MVSSTAEPLVEHWDEPRVAAMAGIVVGQMVAHSAALKAATTAEMTVVVMADLSVGMTVRQKVGLTVDGWADMKDAQ